MAAPPPRSLPIRRRSRRERHGSGRERPALRHPQRAPGPGLGKGRSGDAHHCRPRDLVADPDPGGGRSLSDLPDLSARRRRLQSRLYPQNLHPTAQGAIRDRVYAGFVPGGLRSGRKGLPLGEISSRLHHALGRRPSRIQTRRGRRRSSPFPTAPSATRSSAITAGVTMPCSSAAKEKVLPEPNLEVLTSIRHLTSWRSFGPSTGHQFQGVGQRHAGDAE